MSKFNLGEIFSNSIKLIINNFSTIAYLIFAFLILDLLGTWINLQYTHGEPNFPFIIVSLLIGSFINYCFIKTILRIINHQKASFNDLQLNLEEMIRYFVICTLYGLLVIGGLILFIIPGIYFALKYFFVGIVLLDKKLSIKEAWKDAPKLTQGKKLKLLPILLINMLLLGIISTLFAKLNLEYLSSTISTLWESILFTVVSVEIYRRFKNNI